MTTFLVEEKEKKLREGLLMMGLRYSVFWARGAAGRRATSRSPIGILHINENGVSRTDSMAPFVGELGADLRRGSRARLGGHEGSSFLRNLV